MAPIWRILALSIAARAAMFFIIAPLQKLGMGDDAYYLEVARNLLRGCHCVGGHFTSYRPPGYPAFLALTGASPGLAVLAQMALGISTAAITYELLGRDRLAFWTALLIGTSPFLIAFEMSINAETLYLCLVWIAFLVIYREKRRHSAILAGLLLGAALLVRDTLLLLPAFLVATALLKRAWLEKALIAAAAAYAFAAPWQFAQNPSDSRLGFAFWVGTWERNPQWTYNGIANFETYPSYAFKDGAERASLQLALKRGNDQSFRAAALTRVKEEPASVGVAWVTRYWRLWIGTRLDLVELRAERGGLLWTAIKGASALLNLALIALGLVGMWAARRSPLILLAVPAVYAALVYIPFHNTETRYSLFALPAFCLFAAYALLNLPRPRFLRRTAVPLRN